MVGIESLSDFLKITSGQPQNSFLSMLGNVCGRPLLFTSTSLNAMAPQRAQSMAVACVFILNLVG
jgi:hypothetical protein